MSDDVRTLLTFSGGFLAFAAVVLTILNSRLKDAPDASARELLVLRIWNWGSVALYIVGGIVLVATAHYGVALLLYALGWLIKFVLYMGYTNPPHRAETAALIVHSCLLTLLTAMLIAARFAGLVAGVK